MIIDFHTHVLPPRIQQNRSHYADKDPAFAYIYSGPKAKIATTEDLLESMDRYGVDKSVIVNYGWGNPELCQETNDYILESAARFPDRLISFCTVCPQSYESAIDEIERCVKGGARGIGELRPDLQLPDLANIERVQSLVEVLRKHHLILMTHASEPVGHLYSGKGKVTLEMLYSFITSFPDIKLVCAHWGGGLPFYALMPEVKKALENAFFDTAASPFLYTPQIYSQVSQLVGTEKILFGSDYPLLSQSRIIKEINDTLLSQESKKAILSGNAGRLLGI